MSDELNLSELISLHKAATYAPWDQEEGPTDDLVLSIPANTSEAPLVAKFHRAKDAEFITALRNAAPGLFAEITRLREALRSIAYWPISQPKENMDAANMAEIARRALIEGGGR